MKNYDKYSPDQMVRWEDFKKDFQSPEENNFFWVVVPKSEMADFLHTEDINLDKQLFGFEWPTRDEFRFLLLSKNAKAFHGFQQITELSVNLGHKDHLMFQDFQIHFQIDRYDLLAILRNKIWIKDNISVLLGNIIEKAIIPRDSATKKLEDILSKFPKLVIREEITHPRYISKRFTLESFIFDPERIAKYCTACNPDQLDFLLTYRNSDIIEALKGGTEKLKTYLMTCPRIKLLSVRIQQVFSLLFPDYLTSYRHFLNQLQHDYNDDFYIKRPLKWAPFDEDHKRDCILKCRCLRMAFDLEDLWNALCIIENDLKGVTQRFNLKSLATGKGQIAFAKLPEKINALFESFESFSSKDDETDFPPERTALAYDRIMAQHEERAEHFYIEDIVRYFSAAKSRADIDQHKLVAFVDWLRKNIKYFEGIFSDDLYQGLDYLIGDISPVNHYHCEMRGALPPYFCWSIWDNSSENNSPATAIVDRATLPLNYRIKIYNAYLDVNEGLAFILSRIRCLPIYKLMKDLSDCFCDVEYVHLRDLLEDNKLNDDEKLKFIDSVIVRENTFDYPLPFRRLPPSHRAVVEGFATRVADGKRKAAEAQNDVFRKMGHSIKNLVESVASPLSNLLKEELTGSQQRKVEIALAGTNLIRTLAQGINMSLRPGSWREDVKEPGSHPITLNAILSNAFRTAVLNMFDGKYFRDFVYNYFNTDLQLFLEARQQCQDAPTDETFFDSVNKYFFKFEYEHNGNIAVPIGDAEGTATKLLILFQELFLNAVKYASYIDRKDRFIHIFVEINNDKWSFTIKNSAVQTDEVNPSGIGLSIIQNFAELFRAKYTSELISGVYQSTLIFSLKEDKNA